MKSELKVVYLSDLVILYLEAIFFLWIASPRKYVSLAVKVLFCLGIPFEDYKVELKPQVLLLHVCRNNVLDGQLVVLKFLVMEHCTV